MINIGLTGNIASGKSTVATLFREWGATVIDADELVRIVQAPGSPVLEAIAARFGRDLILDSGELDRAALRRRVMGDREALDALNAIVHPAVGRERGREIEAARARGDAVVVSDIPLLFEALDPAEFDLIVLVDAPDETRMARLIETRGMSREDARRAILSQAPAGPKRNRSDFVIDNDGTLDNLRRRTLKVWNAIERRAGRAAADPA